MVLGVLPDPGVTAIDIECRDIVISKARKSNKPLREEVCFKAIARSSMGTLDNQFPQDRRLSALPHLKLKIKSYTTPSKNAIPQVAIGFTDAKKTNFG